MLVRNVSMAHVYRAQPARLTDLERIETVCGYVLTKNSFLLEAKLPSQLSSFSYKQEVMSKAISSIESKIDILKRKNCYIDDKKNWRNDEQN